jgi:hypothetical protein
LVQSFRLNRPVYRNRPIRQNSRLRGSCQIPAQSRKRKESCPKHFAVSLRIKSTRYEYIDGIRSRAGGKPARGFPPASTRYGHTVTIAEHRSRATRRIWSGLPPGWLHWAHSIGLHTALQVRTNLSPQRRPSCEESRHQALMARIRTRARLGLDCRWRSANSCPARRHFRLAHADTGRF